MKFKTFRALMIGAGIIVGGALVFWLGRAAISANDSSIVLALEQESQLVETTLLEMFGTSAQGRDKIKDHLGANGPKLNVYAENGVWARAKLDLDRDERWDEKWRWSNGVVYRAVAPADDDNYGPEQVVGGGAAPVPAPVPAPPPPIEPASSPVPVPAGEADGDPTGPDLREVDQLMLELLTQPVQTKIKDASKGRSFKINVYSDDGLRFNRAKVDIDRDDRWDESWTFKADGGVERKVSPADDEQYTERYLLEAGVRWRPLP
ncbi:hypothetical protein DB30_06106 [Enhygromyxa salina]|uniref:Uncharacterized protein n=1 Tax=Enhygromyxa salina TaxID=215803 RepID=A0A0C1ZBI3_9BACT|nr:hypothetical protein [Enhygromyxa salina]KIG15074.1 hypothetical protein DB30_06106 [Enhygromyxa salina]